MDHFILYHRLLLYGPRKEGHWRDGLLWEQQGAILFCGHVIWSFPNYHCMDHFLLYHRLL
jgi:hypothetical protein